MTRTGAAEQPGVLSIRPLRRLWVALSLSGLGDWLGLLALTALAAALTSGEGFAEQTYWVGGVLVAAVLPGLVLGSPAAAAAARLDRRTTMAAVDVARFGLLLSAPLVGRPVWLVAAAFLTGCLTPLWRAAADSAFADMAGPDRAADARRLALRTLYGAAPVAGLLFALLALLAGGLLDEDLRADLPAYVTAAVFLLSAVAVFTAQGIPSRGTGAPSWEGPATPSAPPARGGQDAVHSGAGGAGGVAGLGAGRRVVAAVPVVRGLAIGLAGAFLAGGAVVGVARVHVGTLHGGDAGYGALFGAAFLGMAFGLFVGPRMLGDFSRRRLLGLAVIAAGLTQIALALVQNLVVAVTLTGLLGWTVGVAWATARTLIQREADEEARGPAQAFLQSLVHVVLLMVLIVAPVVAGLTGRHRFAPADDAAYSFDGTGAVLLGTAVLTLLAGLVAYRQLDDRRGVPLTGELSAALRGVPYVPPGTDVQETRTRGVFIAFEGGEGAGKTTQARLTAIWLRDHGYDVVTTNEPGATKVGMRLRAILLDKETTGLSSRAETLLYAADRADHVANVITPALERGAIVVTDRYVDSSLAYQGYGRKLAVDEIAEVNRWATGELAPHLTVLLDVPPETGFGRFASPADRMESEPREFHERVRRGFRKLAEADPDRYLVIDAGQSQEDITRQIRDRVREILPDPIPAGTEDITSTFPIIRD
ncbi:dTMP kinase [Thermomonospora umbrina]|uniref:Thymidylate kinase n=1 Tax=Thermomonospora umbrina TaxID=111806 RepID=A0A3D9T237_9ACTN|nr:dTMP kinase [Thermomonospora umbrina]REE97901.1 thymidylate kinase [Thermomonospora umbrina]